jgi:hypothetical protein
MERRQDHSRQARLDLMKEEIAARLRAVCADMPQAEFVRLVERIATINLKYSTRRSEDLFKREVPDAELGRRVE